MHPLFEKEEVDGEGATPSCLDRWSSTTSTECGGLTGRSVHEENLLYSSIDDAKTLPSPSEKVYHTLMRAFFRQ